MAAFAGVFAGGEAVSCLFAAAAPAQQQSAETIHIAEGAPRSSQKRKQSQVPAGDEQPTKKGKKQRKAAGAAATASGSAAPPSASTQRQAAGRADGKSGQELETAPAEATQARQAAAPPKKQRQRRQQPAQPPQKPARASTATEAERPEDTPAAGVEQAQDRVPDDRLDDRLDRTVFVGNLKADTKPKALKRLFSRYGLVESVRLRSVPVALDAAMPRRAAVLQGKIDAERATAHAYIVFATPREAAAAFAHNMQVVDGLHVRVDAATGAGGTAASKSYARARSVFVGNLSFAVQDEDLIRFFSDGKLDPELAGAVTAVRVVRDSKTNIGKGIAFVEFASKAAAAAALRLSEPQLGGRTLRLTFLKQPKAAPAAASAAMGEGADKGSKLARERIQQRQASGAKAAGAAAAAWMGEKTRGPGKAPKGPAGVKPPGKPKLGVTAPGKGRGAEGRAVPGTAAKGKGSKLKARGSFRPRARGEGGKR